MSQQERAQGIGLAFAEASAREMAAVLVRGYPLEVTLPGKRGLWPQDLVAMAFLSQPCV